MNITRPATPNAFLDQIIDARESRKKQRTEMIKEWLHDFKLRCISKINKEEFIAFFSKNTDKCANLSIFVPFLQFPNYYRLIDLDEIYKFFQDTVSEICGESFRVQAHKNEYHGVTSHDDPCTADFPNAGIDTIIKIKFCITFSTYYAISDDSFMRRTIINNRETNKILRDIKRKEIVDHCVTICVDAIIEQNPIKFFRDNDENSLDVYVDIPDTEFSDMDNFIIQIKQKFYNMMNCKSFIDIRPGTPVIHSKISTHIKLIVVFLGISNLTPCAGASESCTPNVQGV